MEALERLWSRVRQSVDGRSEFPDYCRQQGANLEAFARFCTLAERFGQDWRAGRRRFAGRSAPAVKKFCDWHADRLQFHKWVQWLLDNNWRKPPPNWRLSRTCRSASIRPGPTPGSGRTCGLPARRSAPRPTRSRRTGRTGRWHPSFRGGCGASSFRPFIDTLRATLRHSKGLRIDHVMGLFRLFWIPQGLDNSRGLYVRYPADELLAIVAIESHRAGAWIAGEDLGTVEPEVRRRLAAAHMLSYRLLWFEEPLPRDYPPLSLAAVSTHDLPTVAGLWTGSDFAAQQRDRVAAAGGGLAKMRARLVAATGLDARASPAEACVQAYAALAKAPSMMRVASLEDALAVEERPNMPGTINQWPNWRQAFPVPLEELQQAALPKQIAAALTR